MFRVLTGKDCFTFPVSFSKFCARSPLTPPTPGGYRALIYKISSWRNILKTLNPNFNSIDQPPAEKFYMFLNCSHVWKQNGCFFQQILKLIVDQLTWKFPWCCRSENTTYSTYPKLLIHLTWIFKSDLFLMSLNQLCCGRQYMSLVWDRVTTISSKLETSF